MTANTDTAAAAANLVAALVAGILVNKAKLAEITCTDKRTARRAMKVARETVNVGIYAANDGACYYYDRDNADAAFAVNVATGRAATDTATWIAFARRTARAAL